MIVDDIFVPGTETSGSVGYVEDFSTDPSPSYAVSPTTDENQNSITPDDKIIGLVERIKRYYSPEEQVRIQKAFEHAFKAHQGQMRKSGEPYIIHPVHAALILAELGLDVESVMAGLLHDILEDTSETFQELDSIMGGDVATLVDGVTRLGKIKFESKEEEQMEDLRKMFVAMAKDIRVIIIKLADRLHNMRTIEFHTLKKQRENALETMEIYAPLAHRLGMQQIKWELEDISLQILDPVGYREIMDYLNEHGDEFGRFLKSTSVKIHNRLENDGIEGVIKYRQKHVYSIYRKMYGQNLTFSEVYDLCAIRVIVRSIENCYHVLGLIHELYTPVPGKFKDYISTPKPNGYQSLHTTVIGSEGIPFEVQIRTDEMNRMAEYGIAAHWKYKGGLKGKQKEEAFAWVRQILESQADSEAEDFIKNIKVDLFSDEIIVFTPKGKTISLPQGATPIDFAYAIHSQVGHRMIGAKVGGRLVSFDYILENGQIVDIITGGDAKGEPKRDWLKIAVTNTARNKIKQWFKKEKREENIERGRSELIREARINLLYDELENEDIVQNILRSLSFPTLDDLCAAIGFGGMTVSRVIGKLKEESLKLARSRGTGEQPLLQKKRKPVADTGVIIEDLDNCMIKFAKCCLPIPGDEIIGFVTRGSGVSIHKKDCPNVKLGLTDMDESGRWLRAEWDMSEKHKYDASLRIVTENKVGTLADVVSVFGNMKINVVELSVRDLDEGYSTIYTTISLTDTEQLEQVMQKLRHTKNVVEVTRKTNG